MRRGSRRVAVASAFATLLTLAAQSPAQESAGLLDVSLSPVAAEVGDPIVATLTFTAPAEAIGPPIFPAWAETWGDAELRDVGPVEILEAPPAGADPRRYIQRLTLSVFRTGDITLPPPIVEIPTASEVLQLTPGEPVAVTIRSVVPADAENPEPKPPAPQKALPLGERFWRTAAVLGAVALVGLALLARRRAAAAAGAHPVVLDPFVELEQALEKVRSTDDPETLFMAVSLHLRRFLGRRFVFPALESTTTEVRRRLLEAQAPRPLVTRLEKLLRLCDLIKFARERVEPERAGERVDEALALGREVDLYLTPTTPAGEADEDGTGEQAA